MNNKIYDALKYAAIIGLPAISVLYTALAQIWSLPYASQVPATIAAIGVALGTFLSISTAQFYKSNSTDSTATPADPANGAAK